MRVLVADDDEMLLELVSYTLEAHGYEVITAEDGEDALEKVGSFAPDLIVLDGIMPGMDGLEVLRRLRAAAAPDTPVIMLSARKQQQDVVGGLALGANDYLVKPFMPEELAVRVGKLLAA